MKKFKKGKAIIPLPFPFDQEIVFGIKYEDIPLSIKKKFEIFGYFDWSNL